MKKSQLGIKTYASAEERLVREQFVEHFKKCPVPDDQLLSNLGLFLNSKNLSRILFMDHLYRQIIDVQGIVIEFGTRWGQNLALLASLRGIYEPFNRHRKVMKYHEQDNPLSHIKKFDLRVGDAMVEIDKYLKEYPETIIALAYFDFDIYEPTKKCLEAIRPHLVKESVLGFDELNDPDSPGETTALKEVFGLNNIKLKRYRYASRTSYFVVE